MIKKICRGKAIKNGKWVFGYYAQLGEKHFILTGKYIRTTEFAKWTNDGIEIETPEMVEINPCTVGQYIGMTDKNGVEVFDGDIIKNGGEVYEVWYGNIVGEKHIGYNATSANRKSTSEIMEILGWGKGRCEIIGNVYDDFELMES